MSEGGRLNSVPNEGLSVDQVTKSQNKDNRLVHSIESIQ